MIKMYDGEGMERNLLEKILFRYPHTHADKNRHTHIYIYHTPLLSYRSSMSSFSSLPFSNLFNNKCFIMGIFLSRNLASKFLYPFLFSKKLPVDLFPKQLENMMCLVSPRTGRHLQRYDKGCRQVVGCIPYRYKSNGTQDKEIEVLAISAQKGLGMQFPKGGWEIDESMEQAALRETVEEAGVVGKVESKLGKWFYKSKSQAIMHEGYMFPLLVKKQLDNWPEMNFRKRRWLTVAEAKEICPHAWMKEALDVLVSRQTQPQPKL